MTIAPYTAPPALSSPAHDEQQTGLGLVPRGCPLWLRFWQDGQRLFGGRWDALRPGLVASWTGFRETSSKMMTASEMLKACLDMEGSYPYGVLCFLGGTDPDTLDDEGRSVRLHGRAPRPNRPGREQHVGVEDF